jgi:transposase
VRTEIVPQGKLFYALDIERLISEKHPLRGIKALADEALSSIKGSLDGLYQDTGRPCVPPEQLFKSLLLLNIYSIRSHRLLVEQIQYNLLYRWFLDLSPDAPVWDHSTYTHNNERLGKISEDFLQSVVLLAEERNLLSNEHFTVDGTLLEACASFKSLEKIPKSQQSQDPDEDPLPSPPRKGKRKSRNGWVDFHGEKRSNKTHRSTTDPDAKLYRKSSGEASKLAYLGNHLMDNRKGLIVEVLAGQANGKTEPRTSETMLKQVRERRGIRKQYRVGKGRLTVGEDRGYDQGEHILALRAMKVTPHVAPKASNGSGLLDGRTYCGKGYAISQRKRKQVEESFGWTKNIGGMRKLRHRGLAKVQTQLETGAASYNLVRINNTCQKAGRSLPENGKKREIPLFSS